MSEDNKFAIIEGERKNLGKIIWMAIFLIAVTAFIVYGPKKSADFVKTQLSIALTPEKKSGLIAAKNFHGTMDDLYRMSGEQLVFLLETDRYGPEDDDIVIMVLHRLIESTYIYHMPLKQSLYDRLRKVLDNIIDINPEAANLVPAKIKNLDEFFGSYLAGSKVTLAAALKNELNQVRTL